MQVVCIQWITIAHKSGVPCLCLGIRRSVYEREVARTARSWDASACNASCCVYSWEKRREPMHLKPSQIEEHLEKEDSRGSFLFACHTAKAA